MKRISIVIFATLTLISIASAMSGLNAYVRVAQAQAGRMQ